MKKSQSLPMAATAVAPAIFFFFLLLSAMSQQAADAAAVVEHTFVVSQMNLTHLCKEMLVTVVNGQLPGPAIEVNEGDSVAVHVVNKSPNNVTIHWHGVKQRLNCWSDGVPMITQCPILPNHNFTYRFNVTGQEGTLWWHAHVGCLRGTLHGAFIIRPRHGAGSYPFPKPHKEIPIIIGEWWGVDLTQLDRDLMYELADSDPSASTINGKLGDLYNCSGVAEDGYVLDVEPGETYLVRVINAALFAEYYLKIAGHKFTVVAADANYVNPYTTDTIAIAPGETVDALVVADAPPASRYYHYYMVALPIQSPEPDPQHPVFMTRGTVRYNINSNSSNDDVPAVSPEMPDQHDAMTSFYFRGNLSSLHRPPVPARVDERLFITLGEGTICRRRGSHSCKRGGGNESMAVATMNNVSFELPTATPLLASHYYHHAGDVDALPDKPPRVFNFTDVALIPLGPAEARLEPTSKATAARRFRHGAAVEVVFQSTAVRQSVSNPMHLHGHDVFVLAQGLGNYDAARDAAGYNLVDPPAKNTVLAPRLGWVAVRFVADNPGAWYMHCHYEFHLSMGMAAVFLVEDGPTVETSLPPPPADFPMCGHSKAGPSV